MLLSFYNVHFGGQMPKTNIDHELKKVIDRMNKILNLKKGFQAGTKRTKPLEARLQEYSSDEIIQCIEWLWLRWRKWEHRRNYFNPTTLFRASNFERYFEDFQIAQEEKTFRTPVNERKPKIDIKTFEEYLKLVIGGSQFVRTQYMRLDPSIKRNFEDKVRKSYEKGIEPERVSVVSFFTKSA